MQEDSLAFPNRRPVGVAVNSENEKEFGGVTVVCSDGSVWRWAWTENPQEEWFELPPVPGTPHALAIEKRTPPSTPLHAL